MKKPNKGTSPRLIVRITPDQYESAKRSHSGACLIADAIKRDYPHLRNVSVDMATIRVSDPAQGERYTYLTTQAAQKALLFFDQGWNLPNGQQELRIQGAVKIDRLIRPKHVAAKRAMRKEELAAKRDSGEELTPQEKRALTVMEKSPDRPTARGHAEVVSDAERGAAVIRGGVPLKQGAPHPNLLRGRKRHFGAKLADPGIAFREAVEEAVRQREQGAT